MKASSLLVCLLVTVYFAGESVCMFLSVPPGGKRGSIDFNPVKLKVLHVVYLKTLSSDHSHHLGLKLMFTTRAVVLY